MKSARGNAADKVRETRKKRQGNNPSVVGVGKKAAGTYQYSVRALDVVM